MKTVKVRIALEINQDGEWQASGWTDLETWESTMGCFDSLEGDVVRHWIEAEVPVPDAEPAAIAGKAVKLEETAALAASEAA